MFVCLKRTFNTCAVHIKTHIENDITDEDKQWTRMHHIHNAHMSNIAQKPVTPMLRIVCNTQRPILRIA